VRLSAGSLEALQAYSWPGNVRELENVLSRVVLKAAAGVPRGEVIVLRRAHFGTDVGVALDVVSVDAEQAASTQQRPLREATLDFQRAMIRRALRAHAGNWSAAARALGMHRSNLHHLASRLGLRDEPYP
jgi:anaerobic nitric oxide reductase transcription regulator